MSSLLQHTGPIRGRYVGLIMERTAPGTSRIGQSCPDTNTKPQYCEDADPVFCPHCGRDHNRLYVVYRRPAGMLGCWVVFRYLGQEHVPDLSVPIKVFTLPRGAVSMTPEDAVQYWHSDTGRPVYTVPRPVPGTEAR